MSLVLSGKTKTPASRGSCQCRWGTACRGAGVCTPLQSAKLTHQSGKRSTSYVTRPVRSWRQDEPSHRSFRESVRTKPARRNVLSAPSMLFAHFGFARESNRAGSRQYEYRREN